MAGRSDGKKKRGSGRLKPRTHTAFDLIGRKTLKESISEEEFENVLFKAGFSEDRNFYDRAVQELLIATGWKTILPNTIKAIPKKPYDPIRNLFFTEFPFSYSRKQNRYSLNTCRIYPGRIETYRCRKSHRCAVLDISPENPYREWPRKKIALELLLERRCDCFSEDRHDHEGTLLLYRWR